MTATTHPWISDRAKSFDSSGIRKIFDLAAAMSNPINFSIGQPDFDVPQAVRQAAIDAIQSRKNGYTPTQGIPALRERLAARVRAELGHVDRDVFVSSGTNGGLVLALLTMVNPGDEVIVFDPYFVVYEPLVRVAGGRAVLVDTYPDFRIDPDRVRAALTPRTKLILFNSPANPTGVVAGRDEVRALAELAAHHNICLVSDELYRLFCYDRPFVSPAEFNDQTLVIDGFSKSHAMTGWRLGFVHGPAAIIDEMVKFQQYTFVCAPQPAQWAGVAALEIDMRPQIDAYRRKRDLIFDGLSDHYELVRPEGAFYVFPQAPGKDADRFVARCVERELLVIPGGIFSIRNTHFRISYAAPDETIVRGIEVLRELRKANGKRQTEKG